MKRSLQRENDAAAILADKGYRVRQNPSPAEVAKARARTGDSGKPTSRPDYLLEGRVFDVYSPSATKDARGIGFEVGVKVSKLQTQRVVINLQDWQGNVADLQKQFRDWPIPGLKELKAITRAGEIVQIL
ncbi:hypothetical protein [Micromonospora sp. NPDC049891]|uniref:CdiA C-terminal domain-containing protein n=1 Tax=Micromonospora sp. NPDC049891 TaxID=3155655 RepID=UPI0033FE8790